MHVFRYRCCEWTGWLEIHPIGHEASPIHGEPGSCVPPVSGILQKATIIVRFSVRYCSAGRACFGPPPPPAQTTSAAPCMACHSNGRLSRQNCSRWVAFRRTCGLRMTTHNTYRDWSKNCHSVSRAPIRSATPLGEFVARQSKSPLLGATLGPTVVGQCSCHVAAYRNGWLRLLFCQAPVFAGLRERALNIPIRPRRTGLSARTFLDPRGQKIAPCRSGLMQRCKPPDERALGRWRRCGTSSVVAPSRPKPSEAVSGTEGANSEASQAPRLRR